MLEERALRLTDIAQKLSVTDPEVSRHLGRLSRAGLVAKTLDGSYDITPLGRLTSAILPSLGILESRKEYFLSHDLSRIPTEFLRRLGDLTEHRYLDHLDDVLGLIDEVTRGATEYVWIMSDRPVRLEHKHPRPGSLSLHLIIPKSYDKGAVALLRQNWPGAKVELNYLEPIPVAFTLNEHLAGVLFPGLDERIDFTRGLAGSSTSFRGWCRDLFTYYQARAERALF